MLTIIEGIDGSGKTTIGKAYAKEIGGIYIKPMATHEKFLKKQRIRGLKKPIIDLVAGDVLSSVSRQGNIPIVIDRSLISVFVYDSVLFHNEMDDWVEDVYKYWLEKIVGEDVRIIYVSRDIDECFSNRHDRFTKDTLFHLHLTFIEHLEFLAQNGAKNISVLGNGRTVEDAMKTLIEMDKNGSPEKH